MKISILIPIILTLLFSCTQKTQNNSVKPYTFKEETKNNKSQTSDKKEAVIVQEKSIISWIKITSETPLFLNIPGKEGTPITQEDKAPATHLLGNYPQKDEYARIIEKVTINEVTYYHIQQTFIFYLYAEGIDAWISQNDAIEIPNFFQETLPKKSSDTDLALLEFINESIDGNLNVTKTDIKEVQLKGGIPGGKYYKIRCRKGSREPLIYLFVANYKNNFKLLHLKKDGYLIMESEKGSWENVHLSYLKIKDIDQDGNSDFIEQGNPRVEKFNLLIYHFKNNQYSLILELYTDGTNFIGAEDWDNLNYIILFKEGYSDGVQSSRIRTLKWENPKPNFNRDLKGNEIRVLVLKDGDYHEIDYRKIDLDYEKIFEESKPTSPYLYE